MTKSREKQLNVSALDLVNELGLSGDEEWFYAELKELLFNSAEELPLQWFTFFGGETCLRSIYDLKIKSLSSEKITMEFKAGFTEDFKTASYDMNSKAFREGPFILELSKSDGKIIVSSEP